MSRLREESEPHGQAQVGPDAVSGPSLKMLLILSGLLGVAVALVLRFCLSRRIVAPVESLAKVAQAVSRRDFSAMAQSTSLDEVGELTRTFNSMVAEPLPHRGIAPQPGYPPSPRASFTGRQYPRLP